VNDKRAEEPNLGCDGKGGGRRRRSLIIARRTYTGTCDKKNMTKKGESATARDDNERGTGPSSTSRRAAARRRGKAREGLAPGHGPQRLARLPQRLVRLNAGRARQRLPRVVLSGCLSGCLGWLDRMRLPRPANDGGGEEGEGEGLFDDLPPLVDMAWRPAHCQTHNDRGQPKC